MRRTEGRGEIRDSATELLQLLCFDSAAAAVGGAVGGAAEY
jgi:hypothetical protein